MTGLSLLCLQSSSSGSGNGMLHCDEMLDQTGHNSTHNGNIARWYGQAMLLHEG